jgi:glycosyltransferase involved in cell wall biosynthesis
MPAFWISFFVFSLSSFFYLKCVSTKEDIIYSNETLPLFFTSYIRPKCFYEMHDFPESKKALFRWFLERMSFILVHNTWKLNEIKKIFPSIPENRLLLEPNAVDIKAFDTGTSVEKARRQLNLSLDKKIIVYTGHLYDWKGVHVLAEAAKLLPAQFLVIFIGGTKPDIEAFKEKYGSVQTISIAGFKPHKEISLWQKAADILVLPNSAKENISTYYTSPMKLYEYMASRKPIIASDIPSIREIVDEKAAVLVTPDNPEVLAQAIKNNVENMDSALIQNAYSNVLEHTWDKRAERIIRFMNI